MSLAQLQRLLPLPEEELQQVLDYATTLSKQAAAEHFNNLLGESPQAIEFISSFNSRRQDPSAVSPAPQNAQAAESSSGVPKQTRGPKKKKKPPLHTPAPRQVENNSAPGTAYVKKNEVDYIARRPNQSPSNAAASSSAFALNSKPEVIQAPKRAPPSAAGTLISDFRSKSMPTTRTSSPAPSKTKVNITGGTSMHGASAVLTELDAAIRSLEISTNSTLLDNDKRKCNCVGARHPLLAAAPNCLNCGKVICVKEGLGPCTYCGTPLLSNSEIQGIIRELREERGREKMALDASSHRRAEISKKPAPFSGPKVEIGNLSPAEAKAKEHRDKLLSFQAQNAKRTTVHDEAADFETPMTSRGDLWASPAERARQLKMQQKVLAEQEWNARPEYEKRRQVVSIDLVKGKIVKRMGAVERPVERVESEEEVEEVLPVSDASGNRGAGTFSRNPLLGGLIKPIWKGKDKGSEEEAPKKKAWRRVQDDMDDNEAVILDGGVYGSGMNNGAFGDEPACG
ncbi:hypothetical protein BP5796_05211 [Coleophoma crateriformis]|uniref:TRIP4/RQT4 C2HC5-type zinc finger domain-containing protein n=1 Tax=Coleophoma crateriformis TaxID=565419 RepID=A0A3D8S2I1_9HELO|nr:hypothetical protein BP5796_05211 [Coleophoma crateriformis]